MANNTANTNWTNANFQGQGIPEPAGTDENGNPYWLVDGQKISWQQMQQYLWKQRQQAQSMGSGSGFEGMPNMPVTNFEMPAGPESQFERGPDVERQIEKAERSFEKAEKGQTQPTNQAKTQKAVEPDPVFGDSVKLSFKSNDTQKLQGFYQATKDKTKNPKKSAPYLTALVKKMLMQMLSVGSN